MRYKIVSTTSRSDLERQVNKLIKKGWKPLGGIAIMDKSLEFLQIMTLNETPVSMVNNDD